MDMLSEFQGRRNVYDVKLSNHIANLIQILKLCELLRNSPNQESKDEIDGKIRKIVVIYSMPNIYVSPSSY